VVDALQIKMETMHETYGEPDDEIGEHVCCEICGHCITCGDCEHYGCGAKEKIKKSKRGWGKPYGY